MSKLKQTIETMKKVLKQRDEARAELAQVRTELLARIETLETELATAKMVDNRELRRRLQVKSERVAELEEQLQRSRVAQNLARARVVTEVPGETVPLGAVIAAMGGKR